MTSKKTLYDSVEKNWVRQNLWIPVLKKLVSEKSRVKSLEMLGETPEVWWEQVSHHNSKTAVDVTGVALDRPSKQAGRCRKVFYGRLGDLIKHPVFTKTFPYDLINLDYYGGGRWFSEKFRSDKIGEIFKVISLNLKKNNSFYFLLTLETNDLIYPWYKHSTDVITQNPVFPETVKFLNSINKSERWNLWLALIGNAFEIIGYCLKKGFHCELLGSPCTYIGESTSHKSRMLVYSFHVSELEKKTSAESLYKKSLNIIKKTRFIKYAKTSGKIGTLSLG